MARGLSTVCAVSVRAPSLASATGLTFGSRIVLPAYLGSTLLPLQAGMVAVPSVLTLRRDRNRMASVGRKLSW